MGCEFLRSIPPSFGNLEALQACIVRLESLNNMPDLGKLTKFDKLVAIGNDN